MKFLEVLSLVISLSTFTQIINLKLQIFTQPHCIDSTVC